VANHSEAAPPVTKQIPGYLRSLREPWLADVASVRLAGLIRFASTLAVHDGHKTVVQYTSGGAGTIIEEPVDDATHAKLEALIKREYFDKAYDDGARDELKAFLASRGVELIVSSKHVPRGAYEFARALLGLLPADHVANDSFRALELGGWGRGAAKCSEFDGSTVRMFSFAIKGPRRNFAALLLHETGHAFFAELAVRDPSAMAELVDLYRRIVKHSPVTDFHTEIELMPFAADYLLGAQSRVDETLSDPREFAAEVYLLYVARGLEMKERIAELTPGLRQPWEKVYEAYRALFGGVEYQ
jgi:hypothetical protein